MSCGRAVPSTWQMAGHFSISSAWQSNVIVMNLAVLGRAVDVLEAAIALLPQHDRCERHELGSLQPLVQPGVDGTVGGLIQDAAVSQRPWAVLHAPGAARHDLAGCNQLRRFTLDSAALTQHGEALASMASRQSASLQSRAEVHVAG